MGIDKKGQNRRVLLEMDIQESGYDFTTSIDEALSHAELEISVLNETIESVNALKPECDKLDYVLAASSGAICGVMDIFLVDLTGTQLRRLTTDAGSNEDPTWSPDGRFIAFTTTRNGPRQLYLMDMDGSAPHVLADLPGDSFTPHWSF